MQIEQNKLQKIIDEPVITKEARFFDLCQGLILKIDKKKYPNSIFFFNSKDEFFFEYDSKSKYLWCSHSRIWSVFDSEYGLNYQQIQAFIKGAVEEHFKCKEITPHRLS